MSNVFHLAKRFVGALDRRELSQHEIKSVSAIFLPREFELWSTMPLIDKKHSVVVMRRFLKVMPLAESAAVRASLLHDVGKTKVNLGVAMRVLATVAGSRGVRFSLYHDHEAIGGQMLRQIGSDETTWRLVAGEIGDDESRLLQVVKALRAADEI